MGITPSPLLLADASACLRWLVLKDLFSLGDDHPEVLELEPQRAMDPLVTGLIKWQTADGSWEPGKAGLRWGLHNPILSTAFALTRLGFLGFTSQFEPVKNGARYLFRNQQADGSWPLPREGPVLDGHMAVDRSGTYSMIPLQTAFPLRGLAACGYAQDERAELAYQWLIAQRLEDGAWPTGMASECARLCGGLPADGTFALGLPKQYDSGVNLSGLSSAQGEKPRGAPRIGFAAGARDARGNPGGV